MKEIIIVCVSIIAIRLFIHFVFTGPVNKKMKQEMIDKEEKHIEDNSIDVSAQHNYNNSLFSNNISFLKGVSFRFVVDENHRCVHLFKKQKFEKDFVVISIPFAEITGGEIVCDSKAVDGVKRAITGGIIAGGAGAIVGAMTTPPHIMSYSVIIYRSSVTEPMIELHLINGKTSTNDVDYLSAVEFSKNVLACIRAIVSISE